jgi:trimethylamine:corrinoid methyltransferase-like protein
LVPSVLWTLAPSTTRALEMLAGAGATIEAKTRIVRFPPDLVEEKLALVPRAITYHGREPAFDVTLTLDGDIHGRVPGGAPGYVDLETGVTRRARIADWAEFARLFDEARARGELITLESGEIRRYDLELEVVEGDAALDAVAREIAAQAD